MKRELALLLVGVMFLSLPACGAGHAEEREDAPAASQPARTLDGALDNLEAEFASTGSLLEKEWKEVQSTIGDSYEGYVAHQQELLDWYDLVQRETAALYERAEDAVLSYYKMAADTVDHADDDAIEDVLDELYDVVYEDSFDELYDLIYDDVYDDIYDTYYDGVIDDAEDSMDYGDWLDVRSDFYSTWLSARSDFYSSWLSARSDFYGMWLDVRSEFRWHDNYDVDAIVAEREAEKQTAEEKVETESEAPEVEESEVPESETSPDAVPEEDASDIDKNNSTEDGIRPEFKAAMDEFEAFFDEYVAFLIAFEEAEDITGMMMEYAAMMSQYVETMAALEELGEEEMSDEEALYYAEVVLRINRKLLEVM